MSMTGTPACLWRLTGELVAANNEFLLVTGWDLCELVGQPCKIYELLDTAGFLQYLEYFAKTLFDSVTPNFLFSCQLKKRTPPAESVEPEEATPNGQYCAFSCWVTLHRDPFGIPLIFYGHFLPEF